MRSRSSTRPTSLSSGRAAALNGDQYFIEGDRPRQRTSDLVYSRALPPATLNSEYDSLQVQIRELQDRLDRAVMRSRFVASAEGLDLPEAEGYLYLNSEGGLTSLPDGGGGGGGSLPDLPLSVENGGTGADDAAEARTNLGLGALATKSAVAATDLAPGLAVYIVEDRTTSEPPVSPADGDAYLLGPAPLIGAWTSWTPLHDIAVWSATANAWVRRQPQDGWEVTDLDTGARLHYVNGGWEELLNLSGLDTTGEQRTMLISRSFPSGTAGDSITTGSWQPVTFNTLIENSITLAKGATGDAAFLGSTGTPSANITLPTGKRRLRVRLPIASATTINARVRIVSVTSGLVRGRSTNKRVGASSSTMQGEIEAEAIVSVTAATETFRAEVYVTGTATLGFPSSISGVEEDFGAFIVEDLDAQPGPQGKTGATGPNTGLDFAWSVLTSGDPGTGKIGINNAAMGSATQAFVSKTGRNGEALGARLLAWDDSTSIIKGQLRLFTLADRTEYLDADVTTVTDNGSYVTLGLANAVGGSAPAASDVMNVSFQRTGDRGDGSGDVTGPAASVAGEIPLFATTGGKTLQRSYVEVMTPEMFGAAGTAVEAGTSGANDTSALAAMLTAAAAAAATGKRVKMLCTRIYGVTAGLTLTGWSANGGFIEWEWRHGAGLVTLANADTFAQLTISGGGATATTTTITANAALGAEQIAVASVTGLSVGDYVTVENACGNSAAPSDSSRALMRIIGISGSNLTFDRGLPFAIDTGRTTLVTRNTLARNFAMHGLSMWGGASTGNNSGLQVQAIIDPRIGDVRTFGFRSLGSNFLLCDRGYLEATDDGSCSVHPNAAIGFDRITASRIIANSRQSGSFGISADFLSDCDLWALAARPTGRGVKLAGSCGNRLCLTSNNGQSTGVSITSGCQNNTGTNWQALGNGADGIWFNGVRNLNNRIVGVLAFGNTGSDIATSATGGQNDAGTELWAVHPDAVVVLNSPSTAAHKSITAGGSPSSVTLDNTGLKVRDTDASHTLEIRPGSNLTADRVLTITTGDAARTVEFLSGLKLSNIDTSDNNTRLGATMPSLTSGNYNVAVGVGALVAVTSGLNNFALGFAAANKVTTGSRTVAVGVNAANAVTTADGVTAVGGNALFQATGFGSVGIGDNAGFGVSTGTDVICIGRNAGYNHATGSNVVVIGGGADSSSNSASNEITLGNGSIGTLRCQVTTITSLSDRRDKRAIEELPLGLDFLNSLRPVRWIWDTRDGAKVGVPDSGFIAQDLQEASANADAEWLGLVFDANPDRLEASPGKLLPVLVKAVQELSAEIAALKAQASSA